MRGLLLSISRSRRHYLHFRTDRQVVAGALLLIALVLIMGVCGSIEQP